VDESLEGKGLGKQLVEAAVEHAKSKQIKIFPKCRFAKSVMELVPEWQDVLSSS
jgi:predicted GNAT family acetyltransferase